MMLVTDVFRSTGHVKVVDVFVDHCSAKIVDAHEFYGLGELAAELAVDLANVRVVVLEFQCLQR
jgi:hypothetical protein